MSRRKCCFPKLKKTIFWFFGAEVGAQMSSAQVSRRKCPGANVMVPPYVLTRKTPIGRVVAFERVNQEEYVNSKISQKKLPWEGHMGL